MSEQKITQAPVIIIGSGPAGYTAAIYAARANLKPLLITGTDPGGQLMWTTDVENYPGFADVIQGPWLMEQMRLQAEHVGTTMQQDYIERVNLEGTMKRCYGQGGRVYEAPTIIIATGAQARWLGLESEEKFKGFGVSACATCDGFFFKNQEVAVVGGGNTAVEEALYLTQHASKVYLIHRRDSLRAEPILQDRLLAHSKIEVIWNHVVDEVLGTEKDNGTKAVTGLRLQHTQEGAQQDLSVEGVFIAIGHSPATAIFKEQLTMDKGGYITVKPFSTATNIPGVYAAGDVSDHLYRQAVTAAGMGCMAALEASRYLMEHDLLDQAA